MTIYQADPESGEWSPCNQFNFVIGRKMIQRHHNPNGRLESIEAWALDCCTKITLRI